MKKIIIALAFVFAGGATLSTANAASVVPAVATMAEAVQTGGDANLQLVGSYGYGHKKRHWGDSYYHKGGYYKKNFKYYPRGYYKGFCYDKPYHGWCKKNFFNKRDPFKVR